MSESYCRLQFLLPRRRTVTSCSAARKLYSIFTRKYFYFICPVGGGGHVSRTPPRMNSHFNNVVVISNKRSDWSASVSLSGSNEGVSWSKGKHFVGIRPIYCCTLQSRESTFGRNLLQWHIGKCDSEFTHSLPCLCLSRSHFLGFVIKLTQGRPATAVLLSPWWAASARQCRVLLKHDLAPMRRLVGAPQFVWESMRYL